MSGFDEKQRQQIVRFADGLGDARIVGPLRALLLDRDRMGEDAEQWREEAWQCYLASGADPDGADARHLNPGEAIAAVKELRSDYDEACTEVWELGRSGAGEGDDAQASSSGSTSGTGADHQNAEADSSPRINPETRSGRDGVGCGCGWPLDPCNVRFFHGGPCGRLAHIADTATLADTAEAPE